MLKFKCHTTKCPNFTLGKPSSERNELVSEFTDNTQILWRAFCREKYYLDIQTLENLESLLMLYT